MLTNNVREIDREASFIEIERGRGRTIYPRERQGPPQTAWPRRRPRHRQPSLIHLVRLGSVDENIAIAISGIRPLHTDLLMPAMGAAYRVGLYRKREVLMHPGVLPP